MPPLKGREAASSQSCMMQAGCLQVLEEFYENLKNVGVSAATGEGMDAFFQQVQACAEEYRQFYLPELQKRRKVSVLPDSTARSASGLALSNLPGQAAISVT